MRFTLKVWRQPAPEKPGRFETHEVSDISADTSFLEMMDILNNRLESEQKPPIAFDSDCREGICGMCSLVINGRAHGHGEGTTTCQLYMRDFRDGETLVVEPFRARAFPVQKDLVVDRTAFERIIQSGGYISVNTGAAQDANAILVPKEHADLAMDSAQCIGCGACVAACKNASAMLFVSAKVTHLGLLPQGQPEHTQRVLNMVRQMESEGFGNCSNEFECEAQCPKQISVSNIARLNREYLLARLRS